MSPDPSLLRMLNEPDATISYAMVLDGSRHGLSGVSVAESPTPVTRPVSRGGAYFSGTTAFKIRATADDPSILKLLSGKMLGPSGEFGDIVIRATVRRGPETLRIDLHAHLLSSVQDGAGVELHMLLVDLRRA